MFPAEIVDYAKKVPLGSKTYVAGDMLYFFEIIIIAIRNKQLNLAHTLHKKYRESDLGWKTLTIWEAKSFPN